MSWGCEGFCPNGSGVVVLFILVAATVRYSIHTLEGILALSGTQCQHECVASHLAGSPAWNNPDLLEVLRKEFLLPPPEVPDTSPVDVNVFMWKDLVDWNKIQDTLLELWKDQPGGTFVEVGAVDGEFMSQTLLLERNLGWTGLLIEPDPRSFKLLQEKRRNSSIIDFCILPEPPMAEVFWLHHLVDDLPQQYISLMMARSKVGSDVLVQEIQRGSRVYVKCAPLSTLLLAANLTRVDLLTIATGTPDDQDKIADVIKNHHHLFDVKTLLIQYTRRQLLSDPYPEIRGYLYDMGRSSLLVRLYWKKNHCRLLESGADTCRRLHYFDLTEACFKFMCDGHAEVWTYK